MQERDIHWTSQIQIGSPSTYGGRYATGLTAIRKFFDLNAALDDLTTVPPCRQKIIGLVKGKLPPDQATICENIFFQFYLP
jgi:hypothetical protein